MITVMESLNPIFTDDFEGTDCLNKWVVGGRQLATSTATCVERNGSTKAHLYKYSFSEITLTPVSSPFQFSNNLQFDF